MKAGNLLAQRMCSIFSPFFAYALISEGGLQTDESYEQEEDNFQEDPQKDLEIQKQQRPNGEFNKSSSNILQAHHFLL